MSILMIAWLYYATGLILALITIALDDSPVTVENLLWCLLAGLLTPIMIIAFIATIWEEDWWQNLLKKEISSTTKKEKEPFKPKEYIVPDYDTSILNNLNKTIAEAAITHIDWGDGCIEPIKDRNNLEHTYTSSGTYVLKILVDGWGWIRLRTDSFEQYIWNGYTYRIDRIDPPQMKLE